MVKTLEKNGGDIHCIATGDRGFFLAVFFMEQYFSWIHDHPDDKQFHENYQQYFHDDLG